MKPISNTAFYCCGIRMRDAESPRPVCGDRYAKRFMDARGMEIFRKFGGESGPNVTNVARARYIDDFLRAELARNPQLRVILIGCGFDSRAYRLSGGAWLELDEPQLIAYKNEVLPCAGLPTPCNVSPSSSVSIRWRTSCGRSRGRRPPCSSSRALRCTSPWTRCVPHSRHSAHSFQEIGSSRT